MSRYFSCTPQQICKILNVRYDHFTPYGRVQAEMLASGIRSLTPDGVAIKTVLDFAENFGISINTTLDQDAGLEIYTLTNGAVVAESKPSLDEMRNGIAARNNCIVSLFEAWPDDVVERVYNNLFSSRSNRESTITKGYLINTGTEVVFKATSDSLSKVLSNLTNTEE